MDDLGVPLFLETPMYSRFFMFSQMGPLVLGWSLGHLLHGL